MNFIKVRQNGQDHYLPYDNILCFQDDGQQVVVILKAPAGSKSTQSFVFTDQEAANFREWLRNHSSDVLMGVLR